MNQAFTSTVSQSCVLFADIFTFSAKEKDSETGLSYFGSRHYSSDLSIWLSVDPMSGKYPSLSPYVYCANNPVRVVDPDGEEWETYTDAALANRLIKKAERLIRRAENEITKLQDQINRYKEEGKTKEISNNQSLIESYNRKISYLQEGVDNLTDMGMTTEHTFHFSISDNTISSVTQRESGNSKIIDINIYSDIKKETAWHECVHVGDWLAERYQHGFSDGVLGTFNDNKGDAEEHAYKSEFYFSTRRFQEKGINSPSSINNQTYKLFEDVAK
jgi:RHS repeat-associated protein